MTIEEKIEKLRGIVDKKIAIWCERELDADELRPLLNEVTGEDDEDNFWCGNDTCYTIDRCWDFHSSEFCEKNDYQIIPYSEFFKDEVKVDKPLEDWTLKEVKEYCNYEERSKGNPDCCDECKFKGICGMCADEWEFEEELSLTESEIEILKAIKVLYSNKDKLVYGDWDEEFILSGTDVMVNKDRLPSLSRDKEYSIDELLKED